MTNVRRFSRNAWVKAVSFFLFIACAVAIALMTTYLFAETSDDTNGAVLAVSDHFNGRTFEESDFARNAVWREYDQFKGEVGWYWQTAWDAETQAKQYLAELDGNERILYSVSAPHINATNTNFSANRNSIFYHQETSLPNYAQIEWINLEEEIREEAGYYDANDSDYNEISQRIETEREQFNKENEGTIRLELTDAYVASLRTVYNEHGQLLWKFFGLYITLGALALFCLIHLLLVCGRTGDEAVRHPYRKNVSLSPVFDRPWLDVSFTISAFLSYGAAYAASYLYSDLRYMSSSAFNRSQVFGGILFTAWAALVLWWLLCAVKRIKDRSILRHTLIYVVLSGIFRFAWKHVLKPAFGSVRDFFAGLPLVWKSAVWSVVGLFVMLIIFLSVGPWDTSILVLAYLLLLCAAVYLLYKASCLARIAKGLQRLAKGDYKTPTAERGSLRRMARDLNAATDGLKIAVEKELTSQRLKNELITNVSHDLRTPLTSVITYADLLQNEGLDAPDAERYLEIIRQKAQRLQVLTEDLFEASKASSGETRAAPEALDLSQLIEQSLGEMGDRLRAVPLEVRVSGSCGAVLADGRLLCRVFENLLRNIEKYALQHTRVYIDTAATDTNAVVTLRNISAQPLEGNAERLFERFARGDEARSSEGSGLGLAIVKSFMELQNGSCELSADGDLFKVILTLPLAGEKAPVKQDVPVPQTEESGAKSHPYRNLAAAFGNLFHRDEKED